MFNKKLTIIFIILIVIFTLSSVSASDDLSETSVSVNELDEETITLDSTIKSEESNGLSDSIDNDDMLSENENSQQGSFEDLASELEGHSDGDTIKLEKDYLYNNETDNQFIEGIEIKSLTIDGQNHIINAKNNARIFNVTGTNVILKNIEFIGGYSYEGGAIYVSGANLTIENCTFKNNAAHDGGAVYANNTTIFINSTFINNKAINEGGALYIWNMTNITKCIFDANIAETGASLFIKKQYVPRSSDNPDSSDDDGSDDLGPDDGSDDQGPDDGGDDLGPDDEDDPWPDEDGDDDYDPDAFPDDTSDEGDDWTPESYIKDCIFKNSKDFYKGGIYAEGYFDNTVNIDMKNTQFENMSAEYGPAIYANNGVYMNFTNCSFNDLNANKTGGAIVFLSNSIVAIRNCTFSNTSSTNNGGAIFYDANSWDYAAPVDLKIYNSRFYNCSSDFGGAIVSLGGILRIVNTTVEDNFATYDGGAVYASDSYGVYVYDCNFTNNKLNFTASTGLSSGGAIFVSFSALVSINNTNFTSNSNHAAYIYDTRLRLNNSYFKNNGDAVCLVWKNDTDIGENNLTTDKWTVLGEDPFLYLIIDGEGIQLELINNTINIDTLPRSFSAVEWNWTSSIKNQGYSGGCWCFSTISVIESGLLKSTGVLYDFSEQNMQKLMLKYSKYGDKNFVEAGLTTSAIMYALSWLGPINDEYDPFDMIGKLTRLIPGKNIHVQDVILIPSREASGKVPYDFDYIKQAILKCGAVTADFYSYEEAPYFNVNTSAFYYNETDKESEDGGIIGVHPTHAISLVGWDDDYSASNFLITPPGNGAWIIKNSYGSEKYDQGFCYISYYDTVIFKEAIGLGVLFENTENYNKNYQTGIGGEMEIKTEAENYSYKNNYQAVDDDYISAIGTYFSAAGEDYSFDIIVNGELKLTQYGKAPFYGYHTIKLETQIPVKKGDNFTVIMKTHSIPILNCSNMPYKEGISYMDEGDGWEDLSLNNSTAILRVYTMDNLRDETESRTQSQIIVDNITVSAAPTGKGSLKISLKTLDGKPMSYKQVDVIFNNQLMKLTTDVNGVAELSFNLNKAGKYPVSIAYLGDNDYAGTLAVASITINPIKTSLSASGKTYLATLKTKKLTATLKDANGKALAGKTVTFTVNGKTYKATTNAKGVATVKLALTKAKTYTLTIKFSGDGVYSSVTKSVKVKLNKEKTKVNAPKKTFKKSKKVKKVVVTLKNSKGKAIAKKKVTLTINKKKYTAKTNKKGKATFKIKKLNKKGIKKYTVKFAGDTQYKSCKKTGKIRVK